MKNWTANRLADKLAAVGLVITNERALAYIALILNEQATMEKPPAALNDCVIHWARGWEQ
jgi:hypothetical protein